MSNTKKSITIIGVGLAGTFLSLLLAKRGYNVTLYERLSKDEIADNSSKRSYTLTMYGYGINTIHETGLWEKLKHLFIPLQGSITHVAKNQPPIVVHLGSKLPFYAVSRAKLLQCLLKEAEEESNITVHFQTALISVDRQKKTILLQNQKTKDYHTTSCDVVIGADGVNSHVRKFLQQGQEINHIQEQPNWSYKQIIIQKELAKSMQLREDVSHAWTRKNAIMVAYPNGDETFSGMLLLPSDKGDFPLKKEQQIKIFFTEHMPDFLPGIDDITKEILENPEGSLVTIYTTPWYYKDFMLIIGDAAHGFLPFFGQGVSSCFGDGMVLTQLLDQYGDDWGKIFPLFQEQRKKNTDTLANLSKESFEQYRRHQRADFQAIYNKIETTLYNRFPKVFHPPAFSLVASDQTRAAEFEHNHLQQRKRAKYLGVPIIVSLLTGMYSIWEKTNNRGKKSN